MSEWISVKDELPEEGVVVLIYPDLFDAGFLKNGKWFLCYDDGYQEEIKMHQITHWMPLPEPPK